MPPCVCVCNNSFLTFLFAIQQLHNIFTIAPGLVEDFRLGDRSNLATFEPRALTSKCQVCDHLITTYIRVCAFSPPLKRLCNCRLYLK